MYSSAIYSDLSRDPSQLPQQIVALAAKLFADTSTGLSGPRMFDFFSRYSEEIARMRYGQGVPSKSVMFINFLESLPADKQRRALMNLCDSHRDLRAAPPIDQVHRLRNLLEAAPVPDNLRRAVCEVDVQYVTSNWMKIVDRLNSDPKGAITAARTLVETVYMHVLRELNIDFDSKGDLSRLHKQAMRALGVSEMSHSETFVQILGSCAGIVNGIAAVRNEFGDAHGTLDTAVKQPVAHLCVNAAGTIATFALETLRERSR